MFRSVLALIAATFISLPAQGAVLRLDFEATATRLLGEFALIPTPGGELPRVFGSMYFDTGFQDLGAQIGTPGSLGASSTDFPALNDVWGVDIRFGAIERTTRFNAKLPATGHSSFGITDSDPLAGADLLIYNVARHEVSDNAAILGISALGMVSSGNSGAGDEMTFELLNRMATNFNTVGTSIAESSFDAFRPDGSLEGAIVFSIQSLDAVNLGGADVGQVPLPTSLPLLGFGLLAVAAIRRRPKS